MCLSATALMLVSVHGGATLPDMGPPTTPDVRPLQGRRRNTAVPDREPGSRRTLDVPHEIRSDVEPMIALA